MVKNSFWYYCKYFFSEGSFLPSLVSKGDLRFKRSMLNKMPSNEIIYCNTLTCLVKKDEEISQVSKTMCALAAKCTMCKMYKIFQLNYSTTKDGKMLTIVLGLQI